jgi:hypothetical protein
MRVVTRLAVSLLDGLVLRGPWNIFMAFKAETSVKGPNSNRSALDLVTIVAVTAAHGRVHHLPEEFLITGTVLSVAVNTPGCDRVTLMGSNESGVSCFMAGTTKVITFHGQQCRIVCHMRRVTAEAAFLQWFVDSSPGKGFCFVAIEADLFLRSLKEFWIRRVVGFMTGFAFTTGYRSVHRGFAFGFIKLGMTGKADSRHRLAHQNCRDHAMGEMTGFTVLFPDRLMDNTYLKGGDHIRVALGTSTPYFRLALHRGGCTAYHISQNPQADETGPQQRFH